MAKSIPVVKNKLNEWCDWRVDYEPKPIKTEVIKTFSKVKNCILSLYDGTKKTLKAAMEKGANMQN